MTKKIVLLFIVLFFVTNSLADVNSKFIKACGRGDLQKATKLLQEGADINAKRFGFKITALHYAAKKGKLEAVKFLLSKGADINAKDKDGKTPLHYAAEEGKLEAVKFLLSKGADINAKDKDGKTPLHYAAEEGKLDVVKLLLSKGADINAKDKDGETPFYKAVEYCKKDTVKFFISKNININLKNKYVKTPVYYAIENCDIDIIDLLISNGANINAKDKYGITPFHLLLDEIPPIYGDVKHYSSNHINKIKYLISKGANVNIKDKDGWTPLHYAVALKERIIRRYYIFFKKRKSENIKIILQMYFEIIKLLISKGANVNAKDKFGNTVLHYAAKNLNFKIVKYLVSKGADVNIKNKSGETPLDVTDNEEIKEYLMKHNAKIDTNKPILDWQKVFDYGLLDVANSIIQTQNGNFIVVGHTGEILDVPNNVFIIKLDSTGNKIWEKTFINTETNDNANSVIQTKDGNFILVGQVNYSPWIIKLDNKGNTIWEKTFNKSQGEFFDILKVEDNKFVVVGKKRDYGESGLDYHAWIVKFDYNGNKIWEKVFNKLNEFSKIIKTSNNKFIVAGKIDYKAEMIIKLDRKGNIIWEKRFDHNKLSNAVKSIIQTKDGKIVIAGYKNKNLSKDTSKMWVAALDKNGNKLWDKTFGIKGENEAYSIIQSKDGNLIVAGKTESKFSTLVGSTAWIVKLDTEGNQIWDVAFDDKFNYEKAKSIVQIEDGSFIVAGIYDNAVGDDIVVFKFHKPNKEGNINKKEDLLNLLTPLLKERNLYTQEYIDASKKYIDKLIEKYGQEKAEKKIKFLMKIKPVLVVKIIKGMKDDLSNNQSDNNTTNTNASQENSNVSIDDNQKTDESSKQENAQPSIEDKIKSFLNDFYTTTQYNDINKVLSFYSDNPKRFFPLKNPTKEMIKQKQLKYTQKWPNREYSLIKIELLDDYTKDSKKYYIVKAYIQWKVSSDSKSVKGQSEHLVTLVEENGKFLIDSITAVAIKR